MQFLSLQPFVPSGKDFEGAKQFFVELGFTMTWSDSGYAGLEKDGTKFILQKFDNHEFAENFMLTVGVDNVEQFRRHVLEKKLAEKFGVRVGEIMQQPYGKEINLIDMAGVCWHFVE